MTAERLVEDLVAHRSGDAARGMARYFETGPGEYGEGDVFLGVSVPTMLAVVKPFADLPPEQIEVLLESPLHEVRAAALAIMARQASLRRTREDRRRELFDLYLRRHDRINNWDLVDRAARDVVGGYLVAHPDDTLTLLARSPVLWERRTAIVATLAHLRAGDADPTFRVAELLVGDRGDLGHKAVGWLLREAGGVHPARLLAFLDARAATMPRTMLRSALERLDPAVRAHYLALGR